MFTKTILSITFLAGSILLWLYARKTAKTVNTQFRATLRDDILRALDSGNGISADGNLKQIAGALADADGGRPAASGSAASAPAASAPDDLLLVEYEIRKTDAAQIVRTVAAAVRRDGAVVLRKTERRIAWDDLPSDVRRAFIRSGKEALHFSLFGRDGKEAADGTAG